MNPKTKNQLFLTLLLAVVTFVGGYRLGTQKYTLNFSLSPISLKLTKGSPVLGAAADFSLFWQVWDLLHQDFLGKAELSDQDLLYGAVAGAARATGDPYTAFLPPSENEAVKAGLNGEYEGIGAELGMKDDQLVIIAPLEGSPAERAGIEASDRILKIDDNETAGISLSEAISRIRGDEGTVVNLLLGREGTPEPFEVKITRSRITVESVKWQALSSAAKKLPAGVTAGDLDRLYYVRISRFGDKTVAEWDKAVREILAQGRPQALILDLRNNPGGLLNAAIEIASDFVSRGVIVSEEFADGGRRSFGPTRASRLSGVPVVILLNKGSASASEILAAALQYHVKSPVVGETSFGKGTVQDARDLADGSGIHITVAKWLTPGGDWVNEKGIKPDYETVSTKGSSEEEDVQLTKAIEVVLK